VAAARELVDRGIAEAVVVSLGPDGALLVTDAVSQRFSAVPVEVVSGVGAGDAMVAGIAVALTRGWSLTDAVRYGISASAAKLLTPGTSSFAAPEVDRFYGIVTGPASAARAAALAD
jgi:6-phosphofructokinase 2